MVTRTVAGENEDVALCFHGGNSLKEVMFLVYLLLNDYFFGYGEGQIKELECCWYGCYGDVVLVEAWKVVWRVWCMKGGWTWC